MEKYQRKINSKIGALYLVASKDYLYEISWEEQSFPKDKKNSPEAAMLDNIQQQINEYFDGKREDFDIPLMLEGTEFQKRVWTELQKIPYGETRSYKQIATALKDPNACRAVGTANGKNPISIIVPCHRVINEGGKLGGYTGGLDIKVTLLNLERN